MCTKITTAVDVSIRFGCRDDRALLNAPTGQFAQRGRCSSRAWKNMVSPAPALLAALRVDLLKGSCPSYVTVQNTARG